MEILKSKNAVFSREDATLHLIYIISSTAIFIRRRYTQIYPYGVPFPVLSASAI